MSARAARRALPTLLALALLALAGAAGASTGAPQIPGGERAAPGATGGWKPDVRAARRYAKRRGGDIGWAILDSRGRRYAFEAGRRAETASVIKAMLLVAYLRTKRGERLDEGDRDLLGPMIRRSDNEAATRVRDIVGMRRVNRLARAADMDDFSQSSSWGLSKTSPSDQAPFFYRLDRYLPKRHEDYARLLLGDIVGWQSWGVADAKPRGWRLYFKGGWGVGPGNVNHQVALLERGRRRVALAVFTEYQRSFDYGKRSIEGVSERLLRGLRR